MLASDLVHRRIVLAGRPVGLPKPTNFRLEKGEPPRPADGQALLRTIWLSLDPYMRGRMNAAKSYAKPVDIGGVMVGGTISVVVDSRTPELIPGDWVFSMGGWQSHSVARPSECQKIDVDGLSPSLALSVLGMPGLTAYVGLLDVAGARPGDTVVVSAAAGAVGSLVGQIARIKGCRAVGIAGGPQKCAYVQDVLGFEAAVDYKSPEFAYRLSVACQDGIDVYFDNVGGEIADACLSHMNDFGRIAVCGRIASYNATGLPPGPNMVPALMGQILVKRLSVRGFIVFDHVDRTPEFLTDMKEWLRHGRIRYREDVVEGLEQAPEAFIGLLQGRNFGKLIVRVGFDAI